MAGENEVCQPLRRLAGPIGLLMPCNGHLDYTSTRVYRTSMARTLLLDRDSWDLALDATGNIAVASEPYSQVQDVASACRVFQGEAYYDTTMGVPYFQQILGRAQPVQVLKARLAQRALTVPGVTAARVVLGAIVARGLTGQVQVTTGSGVQTATL